MGDPLDGYATQVAPPTPPPAPNLNDLGALQVAPPTTMPAQMAKPAVKTATAAAAPPPGNKGGAGGSWGPEETTIGPAQEADRTELKQLKPGEKPRAGYDPLGGIREGIDKITEGIEAYNQQGRAEHPVLSRLGDVTREVKELLEGGQAAGKPLGTTSGLETNPVVQAIAMAPEAAEMGVAAEGKIRAIPEYFKPKVSPEVAEAFDNAGAVEVAPPTKSVVDTTIAPHDFLKAVGANDGGAMSSEQVELYRDMIRKDSNIQPPVIEYDENGNIIGGDGRHRAMAYALENTERMPVRVHRQLAPEVAEEPRYELNGDEGFTPAEALARRANELPLSDAIQEDFNHGGSWQRTRVHELSHAIVADDVGFDTGHMLSHLHPGMHPDSQMAQEIIYEGGDNPLRATNPDGSFDKEEMGSRLFDALKVHMAGAAGESEFYGAPYGSDEFKRATGGDLDEADKLMDYLGVPKETRDKYLRSAFDGAKNILTNRNKQAILEGTAERAPGTADEYQMHEDNVHDLVNKVKGQNGQTKTDTTGHDEEAAGVGEESDAGREGDRALVTGRAVSKPKEVREDNDNITEDSRIHGSDNQENDTRTEGQGEGESLRAEQKRKVAPPSEEEKKPLEVAPGETTSTRVPTAKSNISNTKLEGNNLLVTFRNGATYRYADVPVQKYKELQEANSPDKFLHEHIKPTHPSVLVSSKQKGASRTGAALMGAGIAGAGAVAALSGNKDEDNASQPQPRAEARTTAVEAPTDVHGLIKKASNDYGVPEAILHAQADQESKFNQDAVSPKGARGVMQLMPNTARSLNVDPNNMAENVDGGARLMSQLHHRFGSYDKALAAYNWSPDKVQDAIDTYGNDWLKHTPAETRNYVLRIMKNSR